MFGFIKKLFGGIFAFLGGLIGGKAKGDKSSTPEIAPKAKKGKGYFLELDETGNTISEVKSKLEAVKTEVLNSEPVQAVASAVAVAPKKLEAAAPKKAEKPEPAKASTESAAQNGKVKIEAQANPPAATNGKASEKVTFAPNYLLPTASNSRRRPGPSMNMFRDMARQVKTPG